MSIDIGDTTTHRCFIIFSSNIIFKDSFTNEYFLLLLVTDDQLSRKLTPLSIELYAVRLGIARCFDNLPIILIVDSLSLKIETKVN